MQDAAHDPATRKAQDTPDDAAPGRKAKDPSSDRKTGDTADEAAAQRPRPQAEPEPMDVEGEADPHLATIDDLRARLARARADYENLKRRIERDAEVERDRIKARVLESFLPVYEYGRLAEMEARKHPGPLAEGVRMVVREFERLLDAQGVRRVGAPGEAFDPTLHEAVAEEDGEPGHIVRVVTPGYLLGSRVLEYAKVVVGTHRQGAADASADGAGDAEE